MSLRIAPVWQSRKENRETKVSQSLSEALHKSSDTFGDQHSPKRINTKNTKATKKPPQVLKALLVNLVFLVF